MAQLGLSNRQQQAVLSPDWSAISAIIEKIPTHCHVLTYRCSDYPKLLKEIYDPPLVLFCLGNISLLNQASLAVIGSRHASYQGRAITTRLHSSIK